jgi:hypothetical protein
MFQNCWAVSDNRPSFEQALQRYGLYLAKGDQRGYVAIDYRGEVYSLSRWLKVKTKALKERLGPAENLPGTQEVKARIAERMTDRLKTYIHEAQARLNNRSNLHSKETQPAASASIRAQPVTAEAGKTLAAGIP